MSAYKARRVSAPVSGSIKGVFGLSQKATLVALMLFIPWLQPLSFAAEEDVLRRIDAVEKRTKGLEDAVYEGHSSLLDEMAEHITGIEGELDMVDYRTARIKAIGEKVEAFSIGGDLTFIMQGVLQNSRNLPKGADASYSGDLFLVAPVGPYGNVFVRGDIGQGEGIGGHLPPAFSGPNADLEFNSPGFEVVEAWYWTEFPFPDTRDRRVELTFGKLDPTAIFDANSVANSETDQFLADIFVNNPAIEFGGDGNGYGAGISMAYRFTSIYDKGLNVAGRVGLFEGDGDFKDVLDRPFLMAELDAWVPFHGLNGNYRIYAWLNNNRHSDLSDAGRDDLSNQGIGISLDQQVSNDMTLFARAGVQDEDVSMVGSAFAFGGRIIGNRWRRGSDVVGIAYGMNRVSEKYKDASLALDGYEAGASVEHYLEAYYKYWANKNLSISPDLQYILNPGGDEDKDPVFIYGIRVQAAF